MDDVFDDLIAAARHRLQKTGDCTSDDLARCFGFDAQAVALHGAHAISKARQAILDDRAKAEA